MAVELLEVTGPSLAYIVLGGFVVVFSLISLLAKERFYINEVVLGTAFGIIMGPYVAGVFDPRSWTSHTHEITLEVMRVVLATGLFAIGVELPKAYLREHLRGLLVMVVPTMAFGWLVVGGLLKALFPSLNFISCLAISACLTPTDPIICATIVGGKFALKHVPAELRRILSAESAANDGLAYPFLTLTLYLTLDNTTRTAIGHWFLIGWLYQVILGTLIGALIGLGFCHLMKFSHNKGFIDQESFVAQYLALTFLTIGICSTLGVDDLLGAFAAGSAISWDGHFNTQVEGEVFATVIDLVLNCAGFIYIGAWLPFGSYDSPELGISVWKLFVLFIGILALRRIPALLLIYKAVPEITSWREALFSGHFGPMGVGAVFISTLAITKLPTPTSPPQTQEDLLGLSLEPIVSFVVLCSILTHGLSIPFFTLSRTVSIRQTFTSMSVPEWLQSTRRMDTSPPDFDHEAGEVESQATRVIANELGGGEHIPASESVPMEDSTQTKRTTNVRFNSSVDRARPNGPMSRVLRSSEAGSESPVASTPRNQTPAASRVHTPVASRLHSPVASRPPSPVTSGEVESIPE